ncbi:phage tail tape measure protein [Clostridium haemolyticum]|uniref:phage tail tape measure protein n=1 Tax=Clostridium haemolyticum TaxID=84025 RepID=UPI00065279AA|nr:phage tail tape measure protein [Clostridium haemolyticum]
MDSLTDLVYSINFQSDLGQLNSIEQATQNIDRNMNELNNNSRNVNSSIRDVASGVNNTDNNLRNASNSAREVSNNVNNVQNNLRETSNNARETDNNIRNISGSTEGVNSATRNLNGTYRDINGRLRDARGRFVRINESARGVDDTVRRTRGSTEDLNRTASQTESTFKKVAKAMAGAFVIKKAIDFGKASAKTFMDFEQSMANVHATMGNLTDKDMQNLTNAAREAGRTTKYTAADAAEALNYEALAGWNVKQSTEALPSILNLAAAGNMQIQKSSDLVTDAMSALGLEFKDLNMFSDQMAKTSQKTNTNIEQLGEGILTVGAIAKQAKMSTAELDTELGILANSGLKGAEGGTALRNVLLNLTAPQDKVAQLFKEMGVHIATHGKIRPLNSILVDLKGKLGNYTEAEQQAILATIGGKENVRALNILLKSSGKEYDNLKKKILDSTGASKQMADTQNSTVKGALLELQSAIQDVQIELFSTKGNGKGLQKAIRWITAHIPQVKKVLTNFANGIGKTFSFLSKHKKIVVPAIMAIVGSFVAFKAIKKVIAIINGFKIALTGIKAAATLLTSPIGLAVIAIAALVAGLIYAYKHSEKFRAQVQKLWSKLQEIASFIMSYVVPVISGAFSSLFESAKAIFNNIIQVIGGLITVLNGVIDFIIGVFTGNWSRAWNGIKEIFSGICESIKGVFKGVINFITSGINTLIGAINGIHFKVPDWVPGLGGKGFDGLNIPKIPRLAKGTNNWQGGIVQVHEKGGEIIDLPGGSRVFPHDKSVSMAREQGRKEAKPETPANVNLTININGTNDPKQVAREVRKQIESIFSTVNLQLGYGSI